MLRCMCRVYAFSRNWSTFWFALRRAQVVVARLGVDGGRLYSRDNTLGNLILDAGNAANLAASQLPDSRL